MIYSKWHSHRNVPKLSSARQRYCSRSMYNGNFDVPKVSQEKNIENKSPRQRRRLRLSNLDC